MKAVGMLGTEKINEAWSTLDMLETTEIVDLMAEENEKMIACIKSEEKTISKVIDQISERYGAGGRIIYVGSGTSGRLGVIDAAECPPTFGISPDRIMGLIAGGYDAMVNAVERIEDSFERGAADLFALGPGVNDVVVAVSASGRTPYCIGAIREAKMAGALSVALCNNKDSEMGAEAELKIELETGPEVIAGSTRLKAATAQKIVLNMISSITMIRMGRVYKNLMVEMKATNEKLSDRSLRILTAATGLEDPAEAREILARAEGDLKKAIVMTLCHVNADEAEKALKRSDRNVRDAVRQLI